MRFEAKSKKLLAITQSKAKMYEFGIDEEHHIALPQDPKELLIFTIGILGELSAYESRASSDDKNYMQLLKSQLISVAQYFDSLNLSIITPELSTYLILVGSAAYYLADMPGSSLVLAKKLSYEIETLTPSYLEGVLVWLLKSDIDSNWYRFEESYLLENLQLFVNSYIGFFKNNNSAEKCIQLSTNLRNEVYEFGDDRELLFIDVLVSIVLRKINNSSITCLSKYTTIDIALWKATLAKNGFIKEFWPAQRLLGEQGVFNGISAVVQMPTSAGKTKSTEIIIRSAFLSGRAKVAMVVAPFRALCREITTSFEKVFEGEAININELRDITNVNENENSFLKFLLGDEKYNKLHGPTIIISTPEKLVYLLRQEPELASKIGLLIFDEGHQFDTGKRGVTYELLLASLNESVNQNTQKVLISAVMSNAESIGDWLNGVNGIKIQGSYSIPTIRSIAFISWKTGLGQLQYLNQENTSEIGFFVPRVIEQINLGTRGKEKVDRLFPKKNDNSSMAAYLGVKLCHQGPVAIFCGVKSTVSSISELLVDYYKRGLKINSPRLSSDKIELDKISALANLHFGNKTIYVQSIGLGILPHSRNIPNGLRVSVEWAMENNKASLVICTSTLAQGVNLPIKYLVVTSTFQAGKEISTRDFHNLLGRAGRSGLHTEGSIIFADSSIYDKKHIYSEGWKWSRAMHLIDFINAEDCLSSLKNIITPFTFINIKVNVIDFIAEPNAYRTQCINLSLQHNIDITSLIIEMEEKFELIQTIESYFLSYLKDNPEVDSDEPFIQLSKNTLAYFLGSDTEKELLTIAFKLISERVLKLDRTKYPFYGKTLLGVDQLLLIETWIDKNTFELELSNSSDELLYVCWPLIEKLSKNKLIANLKPSILLVELSKKWISGASYYDLLIFMEDNKAFYQAKSQQRKINMDYIIDFADGALGFDIMLFIGALADILEGRVFSEDIINYLRTLQSRLKLGLQSELEIWLYERGYVDREICKLIASELTNKGINQERFDFNILTLFKYDIEKITSTLPSYFSYIKAT